MDTSYKQKVISLASDFMKGAMAPDAFYRGLTEALVGTVGCSRASLWRYTNGLYDKVECLDLYDSSEGQHHAGFTLLETDFGPYFEAMQRDNMIVAHHARQHPATDCFNESYFEPHDIYSLLDVGISVNGSPWGLFCCEQVTFVKEWSQADTEILRSISTLCGMAFKKLT